MGEKINSYKSMQYPPLLSNCEKYAIMSAGENIWRQGGIKGIMAKIAFCDDDVSVLAEMQRLMEQYCAERDCKIEYNIFNHPFDLVAEIEKGNRYDILFMDVLMPGENGIEAATEIRKYDKNVKIIFVTSSSEFAVQSYVIGAYYYQLKPIWAESFFRLLDSVLAACKKEAETSLILRCKSGITRIDIKALEYCEVIHRTLIFHLNTGKVLESAGSMDELVKQLSTYPFFHRPHCSYLVNLEYVQNITFRGITMSSLAEIPVPRGKYNEVKDAFLEYAFQNRQVMI